MSGPSPGQGADAYYQDPASFYDQQQGQYDSQSQHNMNTVFEEDEPVSSPELGRGDQQWDQNQYGYHPEHSGQEHRQGYDGYSHQQQQVGGGSYDYRDESTQGPESQNQWEPPYYPGYLYDAATNSYVTDPNWQPPSNDENNDHSGNDYSEQQGQGHDEHYSYGQDHGGAQNDRVHGDDSGQPGESSVYQQETGLDSEDPYANDPYQLPDDGTDPYTQYQNSYDQPSASKTQDSYSSQNPPQLHSHEPNQYESASADYGNTNGGYSGSGQETEGDYYTEGGRQEEEGEQSQYSVNSNPYTPEQDSEPYGTQQQQYDPYTTADGSYARENFDPYSQAQTDDFYSRETNQDSYQEQGDPYTPQNPSNIASQPPLPPSARRDPNEHRQEQGDFPRDRNVSESTSQPQHQVGSRQQHQPQQPRQTSSRSPSNSRRIAASPPPQLQPPSSQSTYASSPQQQQYSSFASVYDAAAQSDSKEAPYDPYAPVPKQSRERAYSGASNLSNRSRPSAAQLQAQVQSQVGQGGRPVPYDPYSPTPDSLPIAQAQPPSIPPVSPQVQQRAPVPAPPTSSHQGNGSPSLSTSRTSTFSPPPRTSSAQGNALSTSTGRSAPPQQQQKQVVPPKPTVAGAFDIPPPRSAAPPARQPRASQPPSGQSTTSQASVPSTQPKTALAPSARPTEATRAKSPFGAAHRSHESQQSTSSSTSTSSGYIPPPPASSTPRAPPATQKKPSPFGGVMQPPARRAPHQRGASAFGSDSPYGALPTGPLTNVYEPSSSGVEQIQEEAEEEETEPDQTQRPAAVPEEQPQEEFVPSWMQATSTSQPPRGPYNSANAAPPRREGPARSQYAPPATSSEPVENLADSLSQVSLQDRRADPNRRQGPSQSLPSHPERQQNQTARPPQQPPRQQPPHSQTGSAQPPPPSRTAPPPSSRLNPSRAPVAAPPAQQVPLARPVPPSQNVPPSRQTAAHPPPANSYQQPQHRQQVPLQNRQQQARPPVVPQLHFEPPSGEREYRPNGPSRPPPPAGQGSRSSTPVPMMVVEETAEEEEQYAQEDQYVANPEEEQYGGRRQSFEGGYDVNDSPGYGESAHTATGATTPSTTYGGEWQADGYDYVSGSHSQGAQQNRQEQQPYDPYAPQSSQSFPHDPYQAQQSHFEHDQVAEEEDSLTPSIPQQATFSSTAGPLSPRKPAQRQPPHQQQQQQQRRAPPSQARAPQFDTNSTNYSPYSNESYAPGGTDSYGPPAAQHDQQQVYDPYAARRPDLPQRDSYGNASSNEVADLGLERRSAPLVSFGFGGRMLLVFPGDTRRLGNSSAYDPANPYSVNAPETQPSSPSTVHIRKLADILPPPTEVHFPGPIFLDGGKANSGKKRKEALAWLGKRISELEEEVSHAESRPVATFNGNEDTEKRGKETRLLLVKLVKVFIENEGKLVGSPAVDEAVRAILAPGSAVSDDPSSLPTADQLAAAASNPTQDGNNAPFVTYGVSASDLDEMSSLLLRGERREAVRYALDHKMWAHAFIIASCVDTDCWKDVTVEFLRSELTPSSSNPNGGGGEGREALRVAYSMFAGLGAESIEQFLPPRSLSGQAQPQLLPPAPIGTSQQNTFDAQSPLPVSTLESWRDTVGMIVANRTAGDSAALTALGDALASNGWTEAAHVCYLLSPQTSLVGGLGSVSSRISLVGSVPSPTTGIDLESVKLTELVEFGCSLTPTVKGQEPFTGFPHLQAFRLFHASALADSGNVPQALKYTEAIVNTLKLATRPSPFYHPRLVAQVKLLGERLGAAPGQKETSSWIARKVPRPTVNSLWSTFEGGFNKFVSGEGEATPEQLAAKAEVAKVANGQPIGPFSHFSAIAPGSNSGTLSRVQSSNDLAAGNRPMPNQQPPPRPLSAAAPVPPALTSPQSNKPVHSPGPPPVKRAPFRTHHARSSSLGAFAGYDFNPTAPPPWQSYTPPAPRTAKTGAEDESAPAESSSEEVNDQPKPQFATVEDRFAEDDSGFISPMAQFTPSVSPTPGSGRPAPAQNLSHRRMTTAEELADLGIGNSKSKKPAFDTLDEELEAEEGGAPPPVRQEGGPNGSDAAPSTSKPDDKPTIKPSKSWLGGWFKREASPAAPTGPGPVKANLGEQKTFYYDEKLKRWVNNSGKGGDETPPAIVPPPRASTASPSRAMRGSPRFGSPAPPVPPMPPQRSQTAGPPPLSRSATSSDLRSQSQTAEFKPPSRPPSAADGTGGARGGARRNKPKYVVVPP
ncbi:hypothetical protein JCM5350_007383 [Sporobolomyces pararoseus]